MVAAMRRFAVFLGFVLSVGCHGEAPAAPVRPAEGSVGSVASAPGPAVAERLDLNLPRLESDPKYDVEAADGTSVRGYPLPDGRVLLFDRYRDRIAVSDPKTGGRVELGEAMLTAVPRLGWLIVPKGGAQGRYHDVDPKTGALRLLWAAPEEDAGGWTHAQLAGVDRGAPLMIVRRVRRSPGSADAPEPRVRLVRLRGPGDAEESTLTLRLGLWIAGPDAVRGRELLLVDASEVRGKMRIGEPPKTAPVFVVDLETHAIRELGQAVGAWSMTTAVPHPYVAVRWSDHDARVRDLWWGPECVNTVDAGSLALTPCKPTWP